MIYAWAALFIFAMIVNFLLVRKVRKQENRIKDLEFACDNALTSAAGYRQIIRKFSEDKLRQAYAERRLKDCDPETILREIEDHNADI